ncbi:hypothetical protein PV10_03912 [Exophiala mesophila]|uniref:Mmc1 C-terminal domain-containing protein n=1 Tax=Exophiala mesophila TaxID=212818 RepID=A0A0D1ZFJ0_EXOME|nr:uncharacterized protein PV10_03912 [Exophiala mesophila]KIV92639.1 hypothetical protein PV10_03912 [Exophiala mesophila]
MKRPIRSLRVGQLDHLVDTFFFCPSCTTVRLAQPSRPCVPKSLPSKPTRRCASTLSSRTAVNAVKNIPTRYQGLYKALGDVQKNASAQVNLSRLRLALQGLESETPTTRVAVLGLDTQETARRLVRLLLADALVDESQWEKELTSNIQELGPDVVIRYGDSPSPNLQPSKSAVPVLYIPSNVLEINNIEILVSSINSLRNGELLHGSETITSDAFLSPSVGTPTSAYGRQTTIGQPVHSTLLVANGLDDLLACAELLASTNFVAREDRESVRIVVNLQDLKEGSQAKVLIVDALQAEEGLSAIRRSVREATTYEHKWVNSGLPALSDWLTQSSALHSNKSMPPSIRSLTSSILSNAARNLETQAKVDAQSDTAKRLSTAAQTNLEASIDEFSRNGHQELQSGLGSAWSSRNWRKLAWYKLFWRVDDVGLIIADLVSNAWLPKTERAVYELSGRLSQVGITPVEASPPITSSEVLHESDAVATSPATPGTILQAQATLASDGPLEAVLENTRGTTSVRMIPMRQPSPLSLSISRSRALQMDAAIADLTSTAQQIVLKFLSISGLSAGLSTLAYLSLTPGSVYEAGTIFALGTAYALWRMQGDWYKATKALEDRLLDQGRTVIQHIVARMRELVKNAATVQVDQVELQTRLDAEAAVKRAREELDQLD